MASREHADERDELARYLAALERDACYRVVRPLSPEGEAPAGPNAQPAATELVMFEGANGGELGPFVRKRLARAEGVGAVYETLFELQRAGMRFVHLPRIIDCYKTEGALVVVSEYVEGATLAALVRADGGGTAFARAVFPEVCDAVSELHGLIDPPLIHRDVKPTNIIISNRPDGVSATLIDFGIARRYRAGEGADTVRFGTRAYAPPEQFGFGQTSVRSDVYALGMVLLFCLTGTEPEGLPAADALAARGIEPALAEVVLKAAAFDPAARYASADALKRAFLAATDASREVEPAPRVQATPASTRTPAAAPAAALTPRDTALAPNVPGATVDLPPAPVPRETPAPAPPPRPRAPWRTWLRNGALVLIAIAFFWQACISTVEPDGSLAQEPFWYNFCIIWLVTYPIILGALYLMLDRRPFERIAPVLARRTRRQDAKAIAIYLGIAVLAIVVVRMVFPA